MESLLPIAGTLQVLCAPWLQAPSTLLAALLHVQELEVHITTAEQAGALTTLTGLRKLKLLCGGEPETYLSGADDDHHGPLAALSSLEHLHVLNSRDPFVHFYHMIGRAPPAAPKTQLSYSTTLRELHLKGLSNVGNLAPVSALKGLCVLTLDDVAPVATLKPLEQLSNLRNLAVSHCMRL